MPLDKLVPCAPNTIRSARNFITESSQVWSNLNHTHTHTQAAVLILFLVWLTRAGSVSVLKRTGPLMWQPFVYNSILPIPIFIYTVKQMWGRGKQILNWEMRWNTHWTYSDRTSSKQPMKHDFERWISKWKKNDTVDAKSSILKMRQRSWQIISTNNNEVDHK